MRPVYIGTDRGGLWKQIRPHVQQFSVYASTVSFRLTGQENNLFWRLCSLLVINQSAGTSAFYQENNSTA